jgi:hypothetical protein
MLIIKIAKSASGFNEKYSENGLVKEQHRVRDFKLQQLFWVFFLFSLET